MTLPAAILAGGLATRLRPITENVPKSLIDVNGEPFLAHQLRLLRANHIENVVLCVGFLGEMIRQAVGDGSNFGMRVAYSFDGPRSLGTAGAVKKALPLLGERFFVLYGDSYLPCDYCKVAEAFDRCKNPALMALFRNENRWDVSNVDFDSGKILAYDKKYPTPRMHHIDYGLGVFSHEAFDRVPRDEFFDLADLYADLLRNGKLSGTEVAERFYEIGSFEGLRDTTNYLSLHRTNTNG